jgi:hypothetical protein
VPDAQPLSPCFEDGSGAAGANDGLRAVPIRPGIQQAPSMKQESEEFSAAYEKLERELAYWKSGSRSRGFKDRSIVGPGTQAAQVDFEIGHRPTGARPVHRCCERGHHETCIAWSENGVRCRSPDPSGFMTYRPTMSFRNELKTIFEPSGDHLGRQSSY